VQVWQTSNLRRLRLGEEKRKRKKKKPQDENIMVCPIPWGDHNLKDSHRDRDRPDRMNWRYKTHYYTKFNKNIIKVAMKT